MVDSDERSSLPDNFQEVAQPAAPARRAVYLLLDADLIDWLQGEFGDWPGHINDLIRFEKDTSPPAVASPQPQDWEPPAP